MAILFDIRHPIIPSLEYRKQHSVLIMAEDAQHPAKRPTVKINQTTCGNVRQFKGTTLYKLFKNIVKRKELIGNTIQSPKSH